MDVGFLDDGGERFFGQPPRLEEARKIRALAQLRNLQIDGAGA
jgi:hypothetical protein